MLHEMTITTQAKYDSKCHRAPLSCGRVTTSDHVNLVSVHTRSRLPDLLRLVQQISLCSLWSWIHTHMLCAWFVTSV